MKTKYILIFIFCILLSSCMVEKMVVYEATLVNLVSEKKTDLTLEETAKLNEMFKNGLEMAVAGKWQVGNLIQAKSNQKIIEIYLYDGGFLQFSVSNQYYRVKSNYMDTFNYLNRNF